MAARTVALQAHTSVFADVWRRQRQHSIVREHIGARLSNRDNMVPRQVLSALRRTRRPQTEGKTHETGQRRITLALQVKAERLVSRTKEGRFSAAEETVAGSLDAHARGGDAVVPGSTR